MWSSRDIIAHAWLCERAAGLLQWAAIAAALVAGTLATLRLLGLAGGGAE